MTASEFENLGVIRNKRNVGAMLDMQVQYIHVILTSFFVPGCCTWQLLG